MRPPVLVQDGSCKVAWCDNPPNQGLASAYAYRSDNTANDARACDIAAALYGLKCEPALSLCAFHRTHRCRIASVDAATDSLVQSHPDNTASCTEPDTDEVTKFVRTCFKEFDLVPIICIRQPLPLQLQHCRVAQPRRLGLQRSARSANCIICPHATFYIGRSGLDGINGCLRSGT